MRLEKMTQKAQAAVAEAQSLAERMNHGTVEPEHLLKALLEQEGGVVPAVINRIGVDPALLERSLDQALASLLPRHRCGGASGPEPGYGQPAQGGRDHRREYAR